MGRSVWLEEGAAPSGCGQLCVCVCIWSPPFGSSSAGPKHCRRAPNGRRRPKWFEEAGWWPLASVLRDPMGGATSGKLANSGQSAGRREVGRAAATVCRLRPLSGENLPLRAANSNFNLPPSPARSCLVLLWVCLHKQKRKQRTVWSRQTRNASLFSQYHTTLSPLIPGDGKPRESRPK